jgi:hypothetical protein
VVEGVGTPATLAVRTPPKSARTVSPNVTPPTVNPLSVKVAPGKLDDAVTVSRCWVAR